MNPSSDLIPREQLSAYQRWELASLHESATDVFAGSTDDDLRAAEAEVVAATRTAAHADGYSAGYAAGLAQSVGERERLVAVLASLATPAAGHEQALADTVVDLALALAQQFAAATIAVRRDLVVPAVVAALRELPASTERATLHLNPGDIDAVRAYLAGDRQGPVAHLAADPTVTAGGCRIESPQCDVDARVESRWQRLAASLGRDGDWLVGA